METQTAPASKQALDLIWGASEMAAEIGRTPRQVHNLLVRKILPAKKVGNRWCISRQTLTAFFCDQAA